jgi:hypothetical protein
MAGLGLAVLGFGTVAVPAAPADDTKPTESPTPTKEPAIDKGKAPDFTAYSTVTTIVGEIMASDKESATIRVYWQTIAGGGGRPRLHANSRTAVNPYAMRRSIQIKTEHHDYKLEYVPESLVRIKHLPPKTDENGKKVPYSEKERDELKVPYSVIGYQASKSDLKKGTIVEVFVIRDKKIAAEKVTEDDLRIRYIVILGEDPNPPKDGPPSKKDKN